MFEIKKPEPQKPIVVIRTATPHELSNYEKWKLESVEEGAQVYKIEVIKVNTTNGKEAFASIHEKTAKIELGDLALKDRITPDELSAEDLFIIECALESDLNK